MALVLKLGEEIPIKGRIVRVTQDAYDYLPAIRDELIQVAAARETITYGELKARLQLPWAPNGMGRMLDLLSVDCLRRGEPSLAAIVVGQQTGEVGIDFDGDPVAERTRVYSQRHWR